MRIQRTLLLGVLMLAGCRQVGPAEFNILEHGFWHPPSLSRVCDVCELPHEITNREYNLARYVCPKCLGPTP